MALQFRSRARSLEMLVNLRPHKSLAYIRSGILTQLDQLVRAASFDHLVGACEERFRHADAERLRGLKVENQLNLRGLLDRQVGRLVALENAADIDPSQAISVGEVGPVTHQAACGNEVAILIDSRHGLAESQRGKLAASRIEKRIGADQQRAGPQLAQLCKDGRELAVRACP